MYQELTLEEQRIAIDTQQAWDALDEARKAVIATRGSMRWHEVKGQRYLKRRQGGGRNERSLGPSSAATFVIYEKFNQDKAAAAARMKSLKSRSDKQARFAVAARINRVPRIVAELCRALVDRTHWRLVGTNCLYAYEAAAGVRIDTGSLATGDADLLWDTRSRRGTPRNRPRASLVLPGVDEQGFLGVLRSIDRTFRPQGGALAFRAANDENFLVDLLRPYDGPSELQDTECRASDLTDDLVAQPIKGLDWLASSPVMRQIAIDEKGYPVQLVVPDPRAFALHKLWLSTVNDREPGKRKRDRAQAELAARLLVEKLVMYPMDADTLRQFPRDLRLRIQELV